MSHTEPVSTSGMALPPGLEKLMARIDPDALRGLVGLLPSSTAEDSGPPLAKFVTFTVGASNYAVPLANVVEILRMPKVTPLPHVPKWLSGVMNLRGDIVSVAQFRQLLDLPAADSPTDPRLIVLRSSSEEIVVGFVVDGIVGLRGIDAAELKPCSERQAGSLARYLSGWFERDDKLLPVFDVDRLLANPELRRFDAVDEA